MGWTDAQYAYQVAPLGGSFTDLLDHCERIRLLAEVSSGQDGDNVNVAYLHGAKPIGHKFSSQLQIALELTLRFTNAAGAVTNPDGASGHVYENLAAIKQLMYGYQNLITLRRTLPHIGQVEIDCEVLGPESITGLQWQYLFNLNAPKPFWRETTQLTPSGAAIAIGGNAPVDDAIVTIGTGTMTHTQSGAQIINAYGGAVDIDTATGQAVVSGGSTDVSDQVSFTEPYYLELQGGVTNNFTGVTPSLAYYPKWRI